jgi:hypothetical protein
MNRYLLLLLIAFSTACEDEAPCEDLSIDECATTDRCNAIRAQPLDRDSECREPTQDVACQDDQRACGAAITIAEDPDGQRWHFRSTCTPVGWQVVDSTAAVSWPDCE